MKPALISYVRFHTQRFEEEGISEREYLETILDLCVERLVDLDKARDDGTTTGSYDRSALAAVMVEAEMLNGKSSNPPMAIDLTDEALEEDCLPIPRITATPVPKPYIY
jgi:hypothetical protein